MSKRRTEWLWGGIMERQSEDDWWPYCQTPDCDTDGPWAVLWQLEFDEGGKCIAEEPHFFCKAHAPLWQETGTDSTNTFVECVVE